MVIIDVEYWMLNIEYWCWILLNDMNIDDDSIPLSIKYKKYLGHMVDKYKLRLIRMRQYRIYLDCYRVVKTIQNIISYAVNKWFLVFSNITFAQVVLRVILKQSLWSMWQYKIYVYHFMIHRYVLSQKYDHFADGRNVQSRITSIDLDRKR